MKATSDCQHERVPLAVCLPLLALLFTPMGRTRWVLALMPSGLKTRCSTEKARRVLQQSEVPQYMQERVSTAAPRLSAAYARDILPRTMPPHGRLAGWRVLHCAAKMCLPGSHSFATPCRCTPIFSGRRCHPTIATQPVSCLARNIVLIARTADCAPIEFGLLMSTMSKGQPTPASTGQETRYYTFCQPSSCFCQANSWPFYAGACFVKQIRALD
jgi:hypothetical protein